MPDSNFYRKHESTHVNVETGDRAHFSSSKQLLLRMPTVTDLVNIGQCPDENSRLFIVYSHSSN